MLRPYGYICLAPDALCPMPYALCPMPYALCPLVPHLSEKGYILTAGFGDRNLDRKFSPFSHCRYALQPPTVFVHHNLIAN
jgi:hypothetical protein